MKPLYQILLLVKKQNKKLNIVSLYTKYEEMSTDMNIYDKNPKYSIDSKYIFVKAT